jgi:hypothetical protein
MTAKLAILSDVRNGLVKLLFDAQYLLKCGDSGISFDMRHPAEVR